MTASTKASVQHMHVSDCYDKTLLWAPEHAIHDR